MRKEYGLGLPVTDSSTLAPSEVNANTELYMRIWSRNLTALLSLLVKRTSNSYDVAGWLGNRTLPFSQHRENCGFLLLDFVNHSLIHIFTLQNPHIVSNSPQSHRPGANASSFRINCNASLPKEGCVGAATCCTVRRFQHKSLLRSCNVSNGSVDFVHCLARHSFCRQLRRPCADSDLGTKSIR
jgi:hypothetical protein